MFFITKSKLLDFYFTRLKSIKRLPLLHHTADYICISCETNTAYFENRISRKPMLEGRVWVGGGGGRDGEAYAVLQNTVLYMKRLNKTESAIFVHFLCSLSRKATF